MDHDGSSGFAPEGAPSEAGASASAPSGIGELIVLGTGGPSHDDSAEVEALLRPGGPGVGERSFDAHEVCFEVLDGRLSIDVEGETRPLRAGEALTLPPGTFHRIWVEPGRVPARFIWRMRPAPRDPDFVDLVFGTEPDAGGG